jgi:flavodoxin
VPAAQPISKSVEYPWGIIQQRGTPPQRLVTLGLGTENANNLKLNYTDFVFIIQGTGTEEHKASIVSTVYDRIYYCTLHNNSSKQYENKEKKRKIED